MSLDRSLKTGGSLMQHRSVLSRAERITKMKEKGTLNDEDSPLGLPKMVSRKVAAGKKKKVKGPGGEEEAGAAS